MAFRQHIRPLVPFLFAAAIHAQTETGQIAGAIVDKLGRAIPSAAVLVESTSAGRTRTARTSRQGVYNVSGLLPGDYTIEVSAPEFSPSFRSVRIHAGSRVTANIQLERALARVQSAAPATPGTETQGQWGLVAGRELQSLPSLTRNPYRFLELAGNLSDAGLGTRGAGFAMNGQRESSTSILLDGAANNDEFSGAIGQQIPLDAVREVSVMTGGFTAEYGRASGGVVNAVSKSGGDLFHGSAYEFLRSSALNGNSFLANAQGIDRPGFTRNQFGYSFGGPILRRKLFFFSSTEVTLVRSYETAFAWVPAPQLLALAAPNTQAFFQALGQLRPDAAVVGSTTLNDLAASHGANPCTGLACATVPASMPLFVHAGYRVPNYSPGGYPENNVRTFARVDYNLSAATWLYARYGLSHGVNPVGVLSGSPYRDYDLGQNQSDSTFAASLIHTWNPQWVSQTTLAFNRFSRFQQGITSRGVVPTMYANPLGPVTIGTDSVAFPGYNPFTPGSGGAFGGPENLVQANHGTSWTKGTHLLRFGGSFDTIRDNRTYAAYQTAVDSLSHGGGLGPALNGFLSGEFAHIQVAIDPQGRFPCPGGNPDPGCSLTLPARPPNFSRSNVFNEGALYAQDYWKVRRNLTINLGLRWEHFGVQHDKNPNLDSNWYAPGSGFADANLGAYLRDGGLQLASRSPIRRLWKPDWKDFGPRVGFAWDISGRGSTTIRGGYGVGYERNFGNVTFNVIQNAPNYAVLDVPGRITTENLGPLAGGGTMALPRLGARIIDPEIETAYAHFWNASLEREMAPGIVYSLEYSGSRGVHLYSISYPNQPGFGNLVLGDPCSGIGDCTSQPNPSYGEDVGYRGNQGFSRYQALNNRLTINNLLRRGISLTANYTWSHAIDNLSSTFFEAGGQRVASQYGDQNITINNGNFVAGLLDPYHPTLDRGDAEFDVRHRVAVAGYVEIPSWRKPGWIASLTRGWSFCPIFLARSGQPFSVFDTSQQALDLSAPRAAFTGSHPMKRNTFVASTAPDLFHIITFLPAQIARQSNLLTPGSPWPSNMSARDAFRAPGFWNLDIGVHKDTRVRDRVTVQLRAELFNAVNHANLYVIGRSADVGRGNTVDACFGCTGSSYDQRQVQLAIYVSF